LYPENEDAARRLLDAFKGDPLCRTFRTRPRERLELMGQLADAVAFLHEHHLVHADIKPENVMLRYSDYAPRLSLKLIDYGFTCRTDEQGQALYTAQGTPYYAAPEFLRHETMGSLYNAFAVDVWALGLVLLELAVGWNKGKHYGGGCQSVNDFARYQELNRMPFAVLTPTAPLFDTLAWRQFFATTCFVWDPARRGSARAMADHVAAELAL
jgi:serine/threonine protein kinase